MPLAPAVLCPFLPRVSPHVAEVHRAGVHWATRHGLLPDSRAQATFAAARFANLMSRTFPEADYSDLCLATAWLTVIFGVDDTLETALGRDPARMGVVAKAFVNHLRAGARDRSTVLGEALGRPLAGALGDVWRRTDGRCGPDWRARFIDHVTEYLQGTIWEAENRAVGRVPGAEEYRRMRQRTAATGMFFDLIEPFRGVELPAAVLADPDYRALRRHADHAVGWFNDLVSWPKEEAAGDHHNLILVLRADLGISTVDAVYAAVAQHDAEVAAFVAAMDRLLSGPHGGSPGVAEVAADLAHWIRGNVDWSQESGRYSAPR